MDCPLVSKAMLILLFATLSTAVWPQSDQNDGVPANSAGVASQTQVTKADRRADRALKRSIYKALAKHTEIDAGNISIAAKNGLVTLDGTVTDTEQIDEVEKVARSSPGVLAVTNKLMVQRPFEQ
jgi:hyperosmotically inducible periplasmic protein